MPNIEYVVCRGTVYILIICLGEYRTWNFFWGGLHVFSEYSIDSFAVNFMVSLTIFVC